METLEVFKQLEVIPEGEWVVLSSDYKRVVAHDRDLKTALEAATRLGEKDTVFMKNIAPGASFVI